jgi:hypothetical protein
MPESNPEQPSEQRPSPARTTLLSPEQLRQQAAWLARQPGPKAARAAQLADLAAKAQERRNSNTSSPSVPPAPDAAPPSLPQKLALAQQKAEKYQDLANDPDLSLPAALWARNLARSYRAAALLGQKALAYESQKKAAALAEQNTPVNGRPEVGAVRGEVIGVDSDRTRLRSPIWPHHSLSRFISEGFRAIAAVAFFMLAVFVVIGFLHLIVTADPVWFLAALVFGGIIWFGKSRS